MENNDREYTNGEITVYWKPTLCIHATVCFNDLPRVFMPSRRPWVNMNGATTAEIIETVENCPTDALTYKYNKDIDKNKAVTETAAEITIIKNGPAMIRGKVRIKSQDGTFINECDRTVLCRCGKSAKLPFCDGAHKDHKFEE